MGGYGSGMYQSYEAREIVENCRTISIKTFYRAGLRWDCQIQGVMTEGSSKLGFMVYDNVMTLQYTFTNGKYAGRAITHGIRLSRTYPHWGGYRLWFDCPRCSRRSGKLYLAPGKMHYLCRLCHDLTYRSTRENMKRLLARAIVSEQRMMKRLEKYL